MGVKQQRGFGGAGREAETRLGKKKVNGAFSASSPEDDDVPVVRVQLLRNYTDHPPHPEQGYFSCLQAWMPGGLLPDPSGRVQPTGYVQRGFCMYADIRWNGARRKTRNSDCKRHRQYTMAKKAETRDDDLN
jgi:hypothetical protein